MSETCGKCSGPLRDPRDLYYCDWCSELMCKLCGKHDADCTCVCDLLWCREEEEVGSD